MRELVSSITKARICVALDEQLVAQAMARAGVKTKAAAVDAALRAYVREPRLSGLLALAGTGVIADDYDPKGLFVHVPHASRPPDGPTKARSRASRRGRRSSARKDFARIATIEPRLRFA